MNGHDDDQPPNDPDEDLPDSLDEDLEDPQALLALQRLAQLHPVLYRAIEEAVDQARFFFDPEDRGFDPYAFSHLVRYHIWNLLSRAPYNQVGYLLSRLANTGLEIRYAGCIIKIWKSDDGVLPAPGSSEGRQEFMTQPYQPVIPGLLHQPLAVPAKLAAIWEVNSGLGLLGVSLVCPKGFDTEWQPGEAHWEIAIPHPATALQADQAFGQEDDGDLPLQLEDTDDDDSN